MKLKHVAKLLTGGTTQGKLGVAISQDRKSILLTFPGGFDAVMTAENARVIADALYDTADELDPPPPEPEG